jgi:transposase
MRQRSILGPLTGKHGPHRAADGAAIRQAHVKTNKNDAADAEAICEAVGPPNMRFAPVKNVEQQGVLALHPVRQGCVRARGAQANSDPRVAR